MISDPVSLTILDAGWIQAYAVTQEHVIDHDSVLDLRLGEGLHRRNDHPIEVVLGSVWGVCKKPLARMAAF
ncbi:hypothetical protein D3C73_1007870 [compost metagenome]